MFILTCIQKEGGSKTAIQTPLSTHWVYPSEINENGTQIVDGWVFFYNSWATGDYEAERLFYNDDNDNETKMDK